MGRGGEEGPRGVWGARPPASWGPACPHSGWPSALAAASSFLSMYLSYIWNSPVPGKRHTPAICGGRVNLVAGRRGVGRRGERSGAGCASGGRARGRRRWGTGEVGWVWGCGGVHLWVGRVAELPRWAEADGDVLDDGPHPGGHGGRREGQSAARLEAARARCGRGTPPRPRFSAPVLEGVDEAAAEVPVRLDGGAAEEHGLLVHAQAQVLVVALAAAVRVEQVRVLLGEGQNPLG